MGSLGAGVLCSSVWLRYFIHARPEVNSREILESIIVTDNSHPLAQKDGESVMEFSARYLSAFADAKMALSSHDQLCRLPDVYSRGEFLINGCLPALRAQLMN